MPLFVFHKKDLYLYLFFHCFLHHYILHFFLIDLKHFLDLILRHFHYIHCLIHFPDCHFPLNFFHHHVLRSREDRRYAGHRRSKTADDGCCPGSSDLSGAIGLQRILSGYTEHDADSDIAGHRAGGKSLLRTGTRIPSVP